MDSRTELFDRVRDVDQVQSALSQSLPIRRQKGKSANNFALDAAANSESSLLPLLLSRSRPEQT